jgi:uncharacterized protein (TIGR00290 family)
MKVVALVSGGKDSYFNMMECQRYGHEVVVLANLAPEDESVEELDSFMFQSAAHSAIESQAECLGIPLIRRAIVGTAAQQGMSYSKTAGDEVEDLYELLQDVKRKYPEVEAVSSGAIFSNYQRVRVENVCTRLGLKSLAFLWRRRQSVLMETMLSEGLYAVVVKVCSIGLNPENHLGKSLNELLPVFRDLHKRFEFHVCGEGGEYETLTLDCPLFKKKLVIDRSSVYRHQDDDYSPVALLTIEECHAEPKGEASDGGSTHAMQPPIAPAAAATTAATTSAAAVELPALPHPLPKPLEQYLSADKSMLCLHGLRYDTAQTAGIEVEEEIRVVMEAAGAALRANGFSFTDVCYVRLWLADMSLFPRVNGVYSGYFLEKEGATGAGHRSPGAPSRACVTLPLKSQKFHASGEGVVRVMLDVWAYAASVARLDRGYWPDVRVSGAVEGADDEQEDGGEWRLAHSKPDEGIDSTFAQKLEIQALPELSPSPRSVLHVRSVSRWAPVCIGPYSQANVLRGCLVLLAGQIGLDPPTMELVRGLPQDGAAAGASDAGASDAGASDAGGAAGTLVDGFCAAAHGSDWEAQLHRAMLNNQRVLRCLKSALHCTLGGVVYLSEKAWGEIRNEAATLKSGSGGSGGSGGSAGGAGGAGAGKGDAAAANLFRQKFESCLNRYPRGHSDTGYGSDDDQDADEEGGEAAESAGAGVGREDGSGGAAVGAGTGAGAGASNGSRVLPGPSLLFAVVPTLPKAADIELEFMSFTEQVVNRLLLQPSEWIDTRTDSRSTERSTERSTDTGSVEVSKNALAPAKRGDAATGGTSAGAAGAATSTGRTSGCYPYPSSTGQSVAVDPSLAAAGGAGDETDTASEFGAATQWHFRCLPRCALSGVVLLSARLPAGVPLDSETVAIGTPSIPMDKRLLQSMAQSLLAEEAIDLIAAQFSRFGGGGSSSDEGAAGTAAAAAIAAAANAAAAAGVDEDEVEIDFGHDFSRADLECFYRKEDPAKIPQVGKIMQVGASMFSRHLVETTSAAACAGLLTYALAAERYRSGTTRHRAVTLLYTPMHSYALLYTPIHPYALLYTLIHS